MARNNGQRRAWKGEPKEKSSVPTFSPTDIASEDEVAGSMPTLKPVDPQSAAVTATPSVIGGTETPSPVQTITSAPVLSLTPAPVQSVTTAPVQSATTAPTEGPQPATVEPSSSSTTSSGTTSEAAENVSHASHADYVIAVPVEYDIDSYKPDLVATMDKLATKYARPGMAIMTPTTIDKIVETECPDFVDEIYRCEDVRAKIDLEFENEIIGRSFTLEYEKELEFAIKKKQLQQELDEVNADSSVWIVTGASKGPAKEAGQPSSLNRQQINQKLSAKPIIGILSGVLMLVMLLLGVLMHRKRRQTKSLKAKDTDEEDGRGLSSEDSNSTPQLASPFDFDYDQRNKGTNSHERHENDAAMSSVAEMSSLDSSSLGGSSGGDGRNNVYYDAEDGDGLNYMTNAPSYLIDIGASWAREGYEAAAKASSGSITSNEDIAKAMSDLDDSIKKGDWASVGLTAGVLANSYSDLSSIEGSTRSFTQANLTVNPALSAELDTMIGSGDWEAVMSTAARFNAEETVSPIFRQGSSISSSSGTRSLLSTGTPNQARSMGNMKSLMAPLATTDSTDSLDMHQSAVGSTASDMENSQAKRDRIRAEIEQLVRDVVPEEIDNVDEMLLQFIGQEEHLLDTLRTMKARFEEQNNRLTSKGMENREAKDGLSDLPTHVTTAGNEAAREAADWAISRSLSEMTSNTDQNRNIVTKTSSDDEDAYMV